MMPSNKKRFVDIPESLLLEIDNLKSEVQVLRRTVDSKSRAVVILRKELASVKERAGIHECQDKATQTDLKCKENENSTGSPERELHHSSNNVLAELLSISKRENKALKQDILSLRCKLHDALSDLKVVRSETPMLVASGGGGGVAAVQGPLQQQWQRQERLHLISQLEILTDKVATLMSDMRCLSADRDELLREREHNRVTVARLSAALRAASAQSPDVSPSSDNLAAAGREATRGCGESSASPQRGTSEKLRGAEQEVARLEAVITDYELLASLQRASQHAPHLPQGMSRWGSGNDVKQAAAAGTLAYSAPDSAPGVMQASPLIRSSNTDDERTESEPKHGEHTSTETSQLLTDTQTRQTLCLTSSGMAPSSDDQSLCTANGVEASSVLPVEPESLEKHSYLPQDASNTSHTVQSSPETTLDCQDSVEQLGHSDRKLEATQNWLSRLEVAEGLPNHNGYFDCDFHEEIVPIEEIGVPRISSTALKSRSKSTVRSPLLPTMDINSTDDSSLLPANEQNPSIDPSSSSAPATTVFAAGAVEGCSHNEGFSDYDSDDDNFEAELNQWQKSAGALLCKAQKKAD